MVGLKIDRIARGTQPATDGFQFLCPWVAHGCYGARVSHKKYMQKSFFFSLSFHANAATRVRACMLAKGTDTKEVLFLRIKQGQPQARRGTEGRRLTLINMYTCMTVRSHLGPASPGPRVS